MNDKYIICLDTETTGLNHEIHEVIEIFAVALDPRTLASSTGGVFHSMIRPDNFDSIEDDALAISGISRESLKDYPSQKFVWKNFSSWVKSFNIGKQKAEISAPIIAGKNVAFDLGFIDTARKKYLKDTVLFRSRPVLELENFLFLWFENDPEWLGYSLDYCRSIFQIPATGAHRAKKDVADTVKILRAFFRLHRSLKSSGAVDFSSADFTKDIGDDLE